MQNYQNSIPKHLCLLIVLFLSNLAFSQTSIWDGTADTTWYTEYKNESQYTITTAEQLAGLALLVNGGTENGTYNMSDKTITLSNNIALNDTIGWLNWETNPPEYNWTAIGTSYSIPFQGTFDGDGYIISGVYINTISDYQGLFGYVGYGGILKNIGVEASYIKGDSYVGGLVGGLGVLSSGTVSNSYAMGTVSGTGRNVGGLVGYNSGGTISNSYATGAVSGTGGDATGAVSGIGGNVGGLVGYNSGTISNSYATGAVSGIGGDVGGLVGNNSGGTVSNSYATGAVSGIGGNVGGLVGYNSGGTVSNSYATGAVSGMGGYVGGLVGNSVITTISNSYATGAVSGTSDYVGGLVGNNLGGTVSNSYATGAVSGTGGYVGGLVGYINSGTVSNSYATGAISGMGGYVGGLVGYHQYYGATVSNSYYNKETSGQSDTGKGDSKTTEEMQSEEFANILNIGASYLSMNAWVYSKGNYPELSNQAAQALNISDYFESGDGTLEKPYTIKTKEQLKGFSLLVSAGITFSGEYINLGNDIALNDTTANGGWKNWNESNTGLSSWTAIGTSSSQFRGTFDGDGYVVSGIYINTTSNYQGLFGYISSDGTVKNLGLEASYVKGDSYVGGFVSYNSGTVSNSYSTGAVSGTGRNVGGLVGYNSGGTVSNSYATGSVSGTGGDATGSVSEIGGNVGGLVGYNSGTISNSNATGAVSGIGGNVGGLVGYGGTISNSYATGAVSGSYCVGGLVGYGGTISNSYATGAVSGSYQVGGLVGYISSGTVSNSYATGSVSGIGGYVGGLVGNNEEGATVSNSYYDSQTSGQSDTGKGDGKKTTEMQSEGFVNILNVVASILSMNAWVYSEGKYPVLSNLATQANISDYFASGDGTVDNPYIIKTKKQLENLSWLVNLGIPFNGEYIELGNDIILNDTTDWQNWASTPPANVWMAIGTRFAGFQGTFYGYGYVVSGVYINTNSSYQGLFGCIIEGTVKNLGITASYIKGGSYVGGLVGYIIGGTVSNSYATGAVSGSRSVGGLVGYNINSTVSNGYATGSVSGTGGNVGGLVGDNYGNISNSYATGAVSGSSNIGGLVGFDGMFGELVINSYYDSQTSGRNDTGKGDGKTTAEMKQQATFVSWNFIDTWHIIEDATYPFLLKNQPIEAYVTDQIYTGSQIKPEPVVYINSGDKPILIKDTDYSLTYGTNTDIGTGTITITGLGDYSWLYKGISFRICIFLAADAIQTIAEQTYTGSALIPDMVVNDGYKTLVEGTDYYVAFSDNINAGTATVTVTGTENYSGTVTANFTINPKTLTADAIQPIDAQALDVVVKDGSITLTEGIDYDIAFINNINEGTAIVIVTGKGNYSGMATADFIIDTTQTPILSPQIAIGQISVKAINIGILLENLPTNTKVELYNLQGKQVYLGNSGNSQILQILIQTKGVYIVKVGSKTFKVVK